MIRDLGATTPTVPPHPGDAFAEASRAILKRWRADHAEALNAEADRVQKPGLGGLMRQTDQSHDTDVVPASTSP